MPRLTSIGRAISADRAGCGRQLDEDGFCLVPKVLDRLAVEAIRSEVAKHRSKAFSGFSKSDEADDGFEAGYLPLMKFSTPHARHALRQLHSVADDLRGRPMLPLYAEAVEFVGPTPWHADTGTSLPTVKLVVYLHDSVETGGWLRFEPGSHLSDPSQRMAEALGREGIHDQTSILGSLSQVEGVDAAGTIGDVVAIDGRVWHGSPLVTPRSQLAVTFLPVPTKAELPRAQAFVETCFSPASRHRFKSSAYPYYSKWWLVTNPVLASKLHRVRALSAGRRAARQ